MGIAALPAATLIGFGPCGPQPLTAHWAVKPSRVRFHASRPHMKTPPLLGAQVSMEPAMGIEPITTGLQGRCSTIEPRWHVPSHGTTWRLHLAYKTPSPKEERRPPPQTSKAGDHGRTVLQTHERITPHHRQEPHSAGSEPHHQHQNLGPIHKSTGRELRRNS